MMELFRSLPPRPRCFMAHHAVPYGRVIRQWNTRGELLLWVNRGEVMDLAHRPPPQLPYEVNTDLLVAIPVVFP